MALLIEHPEDLQEEVRNDAERLCRDFFDDVWARGNTDKIHDYLDDHFVWNAPPGYSPDRDGYAAMVQDAHRAFPDVFADLEEVLSGDGKVAAHWCMEGTHKGNWMGAPATGKHVRMEGLALETVRNGRIIKEFAVQDTMQMMLKLGVTDLAALAPD